jgi:hypothetical protein
MQSIVAILLSLSLLAAKHALYPVEGQACAVPIARAPKRGQQKFREHPAKIRKSCFVYNFYYFFEKCSKKIRKTFED